MNRLILAAMLLALSGCNTVEGFGRDLQAIGGVMTGTATGAQNGSTQPGRSCQPDAEGNVLDGCRAGQ